MFRLLPDEKRKLVKHEYALRRTTVALGAILLTLVVAVVTLLPSYLLSLVKQAEVSGRVPVLKSNENATTTLVQNWIKETNYKLNILTPNKAERLPSEIINVVLAVRQGGIKLTNFEWFKAGDGNSELTIRGVATNRQSLIAFEKRLNDTKLFSSVTLPVSSLAKDSNISFDLKLSPKLTP